MDVQSIIATITIIIASLLAIHFLARKFFPPKKDVNCQDTACKGCPLSENCNLDEKEENTDA